MQSRREQMKDYEREKQKKEKDMHDYLGSDESGHVSDAGQESF